jgi:tetraacyldisaccharide 4'-kinase
MKAPSFWYRAEGFEARLLAPLEHFFRAGAALRRFFANPYQAKAPVICIGNVVAGGAGKTPTALALAALLQKQGHRPVFVTRGYGGAERGPLRVDSARHSAADVGDEALLLARQAPVWIGRDRAAAIREAEKTASHVILDDGLQNPNIKPDVSLLVMDGAAGLGNGHMIPAGPLREPFADALRRVDAVLVVGQGLEQASASFGKPVLRASLQPAIPDDFPREAKFLAFAGIGRPEKFYALCRKEGLTLAATKDFADHHPFTQAELQSLARKAETLGARLLTTEKDFARLPAAVRARVLTFPIQLKFSDIAAVELMLALPQGCLTLRDER